MYIQTDLSLDEAQPFTQAKEAYETPKTEVAMSEMEAAVQGLPKPVGVQQASERTGHLPNADIAETSKAELKSTEGKAAAVMMPSKVGVSRSHCPALAHRS